MSGLPSISHWSARKCFNSCAFVRSYFTAGIFLNIVLIYFWWHCIVAAVSRLSLVAVDEVDSLGEMWGTSHCSGFSHCGAWARGHTDSLAVTCRLECSGFSSCGA